MGTMKPSIDTKEPGAMQFDHVRVNLKREQILEGLSNNDFVKHFLFPDVESRCIQTDRYSEIDRSNRILLQKMSDIMRHPTLSKAMKPNAGLLKDFC